MTTTIQITMETKHRLDELKKTKKITYDEIVSNLLKHEEQKKLQEEVAHYYAAHAYDDLAEVNDWIHTEKEL